jgi:parallel beta-helix repeat protein
MKRPPELLGVAVLLLSCVPVDAQAGIARYVNASDRSCGGHSPCYGTVQTGVNASQPGDSVQIQAGIYVEQVSIRDKNNTTAAGETARIVIQADPEAPVGSVILRGAVTRCADGHAIQIKRSRFVTIRGLVITGAGAQAIALVGADDPNQAIHIERNRIVGNGGSSCNGGITIAHAIDTLIVNNLIHGNGRDGIETVGAAGGPHDIIQNTIHGNGWSGISVGRNHRVLLANNAITGNGRASGTNGGRFGVTREAPPGASAATIQLLNNLICGNRLGEIDGPVLDATDSGNLTPSGTEGAGVTASAGCDSEATVYADVNGPDRLADTADDDFAPALDSPALDRGLDAGAVGLPASFTSLLEADFWADSARPEPGRPGGMARFDIGAVELALPDTQAPEVSFSQPADGAFVRGSVTVVAQASDDGGIASLGLRAGSQPLPATLVPTPPAASITAAAAWDTAALADGAHALTVMATDRAGNSASAQRVAMVDNTPPDTWITDGPVGTTLGPTAMFRFAGTDNVSAAGNLVFAWRADGGAFTAFSSAVSVTLDTLTAGLHTFEVKARDQAGNEDPTPARRTFSVTSLRVTITDPVDGATVPAGLLLVRGTLDAAGQEAGVSVNGMAAAVQGQVFAVQVSVTVDTTMLTATVTGLGGARASHGVSVAVVTSATPLAALTTLPFSGVAPMTVQFTLEGVAAASIALDAEGDGSVDFVGANLDGQRFTYTRPGLYIPTARITDAQGGQLTVTTAVVVETPAAVDQRFQALWNGFKARLAASDTSGALAYLSPAIRSQFGQVFQALAADLPGVAASLEDPVLVELLDDLAEAAVVRLEGVTPFLYFIYFRRDGLGRWLIEEM